MFQNTGIGAFRKFSQRVMLKSSVVYSSSTPESKKRKANVEDAAPNKEQRGPFPKNDSFVWYNTATEILDNSQISNFHF